MSSPFCVLPSTLERTHVIPSLLSVVSRLEISTSARASTRDFECAVFLSHFWSCYSAAIICFIYLFIYLLIQFPMSCSITLQRADWLYTFRCIMFKYDKLKRVFWQVNWTFSHALTRDLQLGVKNRYVINLCYNRWTSQHFISPLKKSPHPSKTFHS